MIFTEDRIGKIVNTIDEVIKENVTTMEMACDDRHSESEKFVFNLKFTVETNGEIKNDIVFKTGGTVKKTYDVPSE